MAEQEEKIVLETYQAKDGALETSDNLRTKGDKPGKDVEYDPRPVLPVLFLPGLMASNLKHEEMGMVWEPGSDMFMAENYLFKSATERQLWLDPNVTKVSEDGAIGIPLPGYVKTAGYKDFRAQIESPYKTRKWGTIMSDFHTFMYDVEKLLSRPFDHSQGAFRLPKTFDELTADDLREKIADLIALAPQDVGGQNGLPKVGVAEIKDIYGGVQGQHNGLRFEVWGGGYNWLESNEESAKKIAELIEATIIPHYAKASRPAEKFLLVTHSMGGFVARSLMQMEGMADRIIGVVHGAMPANGAADTYVRARRGVGGFGMGRVLGRNAEHMTRVLSQAIGPLELLPFAESYNKKPVMEVSAEKTNSPLKTTMSGIRGITPRPGVWLHVPGHGKEPEKHLPGPGGDVYETVYKSRKWYGLVPEHNLEYINPKTMPASVVGDLNNKTPEKMFDKLIDKVEIFHDKIRGKYHEETYTAWAAAQGDYLTPMEVYWNITRPTKLGMRDIEAQALYGNPDSGTGQILLPSITMEDYLTPSNFSEYFSKLSNALEANLIPLLARGDQTVPIGTWLGDLETAGFQGYFIHGAPPRSYGVLGTPHELQELELSREGYAHQDSFFDPRSLYFSLYSIIKIVHPKLKDLP